MRSGIVAFAMVALCLVLPSAAMAAPINVTTTTDEFNAGTRCSLREAIWSADNDSNTMAPGCPAGSGNDTIAVPGGTYRLQRSGADENADLTGDLDVTAQTTIIHRGISPAIIQSNVSDRVFDTSAAGGVILDGLSITGGNASSLTTTSGGGILTSGQLTVRNSVIFSNRATFGGGIATNGSANATLVNTTVASNDAYEDGGGVDVETAGAITLSSVTVAGNSADADNNGGGGGGGASAATSGLGGTLAMRNTILARNSDGGGEQPDCVEFGGTITSQGHSLIGDSTGCSYSGGSGDVVNRNPQFLGLINNGGPTLTRAVRKTSPAIDKGAGCPSTDQRGVLRNLGGRCEMGAWELVRCSGVVVNRIGTNAADRIEGTQSADGFLGLGGSDLLLGRAGNDGLCGGNGGDRLEGGAGGDKMDGGAGRDTCLGGSGKDTSKSCELPKPKKHRRAA